MVDTEKKERFIELRAAGLSFDTIAKRLEVSKPTLIKMSRELSAQIEQLRYINLESLAERYKILKAERLESLGRLLEKIDSAVEAADLSQLRADKLFELKMKVTEKMQAELAGSFKVETGQLSRILVSDTAGDYTLKID